ncbi:hypothetical protein BU17DRAFT_83157 [Hysterangium stoloniferum]|nr:hypothetical protein BU17DRAFT_83157 [Hysterangium stoloniferum]
MHPSEPHPYSTFPLQGHSDATYNHGGAPLQRATHTAQHALPSHHAVTVHLDHSPLRDSSEFIGDAWSYPQTDAETISTEYEIIHISSDSSMAQALQPISRLPAIDYDSSNPSRLHESKMDRANDASHTPARMPTNSTSSMVFPDHAGGMYISVGDTSISPDNCLAGGIYPSAGQHISNRDLTPLWERELQPTPYDGRNDHTQPSGELSAGPNLTSPPTPQSSASGPSPSPSPSPLPSHCPWGGIYLSDGRKYPCLFKVNRKGETKVLEHWAREHVANEIFALHVGLITEWHQAHFVDCLAKLWTATLDLGICPNVNCLGRSYKAVGDRREMVQRHLLNHPECEAFFTEFEAAFRAPPKTGYADMVEELGYGNPTNLS